MFYQNLIRKIPINDNVLEYAVKLAVKTRPNTKHAAEISNQYLKWGAGPRASQYLVLAQKHMPRFMENILPILKMLRQLRHQFCAQDYKKLQSRSRRYFG
jgi:hypothetical protein